MKGFINIIKPSGMSSAYAVGMVKRKLRTPCGHMGTLDPMASGVLPIGIGKTSRLFDYLLDKDKTYLAEFRFGITTDTLDITGQALDTCVNIPTEKEIREVLSNFIGDIDQMPPKYSAKCIDGKRGYQLARQGVEFELKPKKVHIDSIELLEQINETDFKFRIKCKGGTYIRSLARDIGEKTNSLAVMSSLIREQSGIFNLENGVTFDEFKNAEKIERYVINAEESVFFESVILTNKQATRLLNGLYDDYEIQDGTYKVFNENEFWGVGEIKNKKLKMRAYVKD